MTLNIFKCRKGFTLVELLAVIAITGIIITTAYTFLFANQSAYFSVMAKIDAQTNVRIAMDNVITNIRRCDQKELSKIVGGNQLLLKIPDKNNTLTDFLYTVEKNTDTNFYELILTKNTTKYVIATNIDGDAGFIINNTVDNVITVKIKTQVKRYNQISTFEVDNYHRIMVDI